MAELSLRQRYGYLPAVLVMVLETAGEDAMLRLVSSYGGIRLAVGRCFDEDGDLAKAVGVDAGRRIHAHLKAGHILHFDVPRMTRTLEYQRRARVLNLRADGVKIADIALTVGTTERAVYYVLSGAKGAVDDRQMALPI